MFINFSLIPEFENECLFVKNELFMKYLAGPTLYHIWLHPFISQTCYQLAGILSVKNISRTEHNFVTSVVGQHNKQIAGIFSQLGYLRGTHQTLPGSFLILGHHTDVSALS